MGSFFVDAHKSKYFEQKPNRKSPTTIYSSTDIYTTDMAMKTTTTRHEKNASAAVSLLGWSGLKTVLLATMAATGAVVDAQDACRFPPEPFRSFKGALPRT
jgi:NAD/NADP transhydrogenase alpha subunit